MNGLLGTGFLLLVCLGPGCMGEGNRFAEADLRFKGTDGPSDESSPTTHPIAVPKGTRTATVKLWYQADSNGSISLDYRGGNDVKSERFDAAKESTLDPWVEFEPQTGSLELRTVLASGHIKYELAFDWK